MANPSGKVVSVNVGTAREFDYGGRPARSAIWKSPVAGRVAVRGENLQGDEQADRKAHGGPDKAVYAYAVGVGELEALGARLASQGEGPTEPGGGTWMLRVGSCAMGIMAKVPRSGDVKTRLVPPLTHQQATLLSECFLRDVAASIARTVEAHPGRVQGLAVYLPQGGERAFDRLLPQSFRLLLQRGNDLGERLFHATEDLLSAGFDSVCLVNADSPTLPDSLLREAMLALQAPEERVVLGPATDGGYYLIGLKRAHRRLFQGISWSTSEVLTQTVERAREMSLDVHLLPEWYDVDDRHSLRLLCRELFGASGGGAWDGAGKSTRVFLETLLPQLDSSAVE